MMTMGKLLASAELILSEPTTATVEHINRKNKIDKTVKATSRKELSLSDFSI